MNKQLTIEEILFNFAKRIENMPRGKTYGVEDEKAAINKIVMEMTDIDGSKMSLYHDLYSGKTKEWTDGFRTGFDMYKNMVKETAHQYGLGDK